MIVWLPVLYSSLADLVSCVPTGQGRSGKEINSHKILFCCMVKACIGNRYVVVPKLCSIKPLLESFSQFSPPPPPLSLSHLQFFILSSNITGTNCITWIMCNTYTCITCISCITCITCITFIICITFVTFITCITENRKAHIADSPTTWNLEMLAPLNKIKRIQSNRGLQITKTMK